MSSATTAACSPFSGATPPTTLVPPPNGTTAIERFAHSCQQRLQLLGVAWVQHRVVRLRRFARAQTHEVGVALAGGMPDALGVIVAHGVAAEQRMQLRTGALG